ncbi:hypothetical protein [Marinicella meishanensis]|nr:hypothetical protein [Marinicella sp. NBU2979]
MSIRVSGDLRIDDGDGGIMVIGLAGRFMLDDDAGGAVSVNAQDPQ